MRKGKYGITFSFYAVLAFIFALFGLTTVGFGLLIFLIVAEKDEWAVRQSIQALGINLIGTFFSTSGMGAFRLVNFPIINRDTTWDGLLGSGYYFIEGVIGLILFICIIIAISKVMKEQDAGLPLLSRFSDWAYGVMRPKVDHTANQQNYYPQGQNMYYRNQMPNGEQMNGQRNKDYPYQQHMNQQNQMNPPLYNQAGQPINQRGQGNNQPMHDRGLVNGQPMNQRNQGNNQPINHRGPANGQPIDQRSQENNQPQNQTEVDQKVETKTETVSNPEDKNH
ncbi:MAG TPA: hypothetical protein IAC41_10575 [Candidatus Merdenecus merdavium]|nr:hypothetical protein [Candidatus Merdenecus merdavium]